MAWLPFAPVGRGRAGKKSYRYTRHNHGENRMATVGKGETMTKAESEAAAIIGRKGGQSKSEKKRAASRRNGKLGGRPKKDLDKHEEGGKG